MEMVGGSLQAPFFQTSDLTSDFVTMADLAYTSHGAGGIDSILKLAQLVLIGSLSFAAFLCSKFFGFPGSTILVSGTTTSGASSASS